MALTTLGALIGAVLGGPISDRFGRKLVIFACDGMYVAGALVMGFAPNLTALCFGRLLVGFAVGTSSVNIPVYLSELAPIRVRGAMTASNTAMIDVGQLVAYSMNAVGAEVQASPWLESTRFQNSNVKKRI